jgi:hypothetical protein
MYKIVGSDGKQYGSLTTEVVKQWIAERRVERRTPVFVDGASEWTFLGLLPEFAGHFASQTPPPQTPPPLTASSPARSSGFATTGLVCGLLSIVCCCCCGIPFSLLGVVFSLMALSQINRNPDLYEGRAQAVTGLVLSIISMAGGLFSFVWSLLFGHTNIMLHTGQF